MMQGVSSFSKRETPQSAVEPVPPRARRIIALVLGFAVLLGGAYAVGRADAGSKTEAVKEQAAAAQATHQQATANLAAQVQSERRRIVLLEARRRIHVALIALDERNFGIASQELDGAGSMMSTVEGAADGPIAELSARLHGYKTVVTNDLGSQRAEIVAFAKKLDVVLDREEPPRGVETAN
jgi:hypothetical protein